MNIIHHRFDTIDSTRLWVKEHSNELDADALTVVSALEQTTGQGKFGRGWVSPHGANILTTLALFTNPAPNLILVWAMAVIEVLEKLNLNPCFKWPNDIQINGKKLGGTLCEITSIKGKNLIALSLGLNVNIDQSQAATIDQPATSLFIETGKNLEIKPLLDEIIEAFLPKLSLFEKSGFTPFAKRFEKFISFKKGQKVRFDNYQQVLEGLFHSVGSDGSIKLELLPDHKIHTFFAGEFLD